MGHVIFLSMVPSTGMEDKFLPSMQQPNHGSLRFITVCSVGDDGGAQLVAYMQLGAYRSLSWSELL